MRNRRELCKTRNYGAIFHRREIKQSFKNVCNVSSKNIQQLCSDSFLIDILSKKKCIATKKKKTSAKIETNLTQQHC